MCYESRKLREHGKNYATHDVELATTIHALKVWRHYLLGRKFEIQTDHMRLKHMFDQSDLNSMLELVVMMVQHNSGSSGDIMSSC